MKKITTGIIKDYKLPDELFYAPEPRTVDGAIEIRTSDRANWKSCKRRWYFSSGLHKNLESTEAKAPLWFGTGFHFALEDFHGYQKYGGDRPSVAFRRYYEACKKIDWLPEGHEELLNLGVGMLDYYSMHWLKTRPYLQTLKVDGEFQVEVDFRIELPIKGPKGEPVYYKGTFDRVAVDEYGDVYIVEYKTAKQYSGTHFELDPQVTAYCWAAQNWYGVPISGVIYQQHIKDLPGSPRYLVTKGKYSVDKRQKVTYNIYREALLQMYSSIECAPEDNRKFLEYLAEQETEYGDRFIRRDFIKRTQREIDMETVRVLEEVSEMVRVGQFLYPRPSRECSIFCSFFDVCVGIESGDDWEYYLDQYRERSEPKWREYL